MFSLPIKYQQPNNTRSQDKTMDKLFNKNMIALILSIALFGLPSCAVTGVDNSGDSRRINSVMWNKQVNANIDSLLAKKAPTDQTRLVFVRSNDRYSEQTSANIAINNRFQVSLQQGNYTVVNSCIGTNQLSAYATGFKNNDLLANKKDFELTGGQTYFFYVDMAETGQSNLKQVTVESAMQLLKNKRYQSHQISRVVPNCPTPVALKAQAIPMVMPVNIPTPVLAEKITIDLEVLFETDKAIVRQDYYSKIVELAEFMTQYPNTVATIEGHTDSRGSDDYNQSLSQRRVNAVQKVLIEKFNIAAERVNAIGYGELQPRASNDSAEGRQLNRRVIAIVEERLITK